MVEFNPDIPPPIRWMHTFTPNSSCSPCAFGARTTECNPCKSHTIGNYGASASTWHDFLTTKHGYGLVAIELLDRKCKNCQRQQHNMWFVDGYLLAKAGHRIATHNELIDAFWRAHFEMKSIGGPWACIHVNVPCLLNAHTRIAVMGVIDGHMAMLSKTGERGSLDIAEAAIADAVSNSERASVRLSRWMSSSSGAAMTRELIARLLLPQMDSACPKDEPGTRPAQTWAEREMVDPRPRQPLSIHSRVRLNDGWLMPLLGLGTGHMLPGKQTERSVLDALRLGYRLIDTASIYRNEEDVGRSVTHFIRESSTHRHSIFVTTKLWDTDHGYHEAIAAGRQSLQKLGLEYIDLYLIHSMRPETASASHGKLIETWDGMIELQRQGLVRSIGVSHFEIEHLEELAASKRPAPAVNQFEMNPAVIRERSALLNYCRKHRIMVMAHGSMFSGQEGMVRNGPLRAVAEEIGRSSRQILLRWGLQMDLAVIPKSTRLERLVENSDIFDFSLTATHMMQLSQNW